MNSISVRALNTIFQKWEISANSNQWNISGEPCSGAAIDDSTTFNDPNHNPFIKCECSSNSICHITQLYVSLLYILVFCFLCHFCLELQFLYIFFKKEIIKLHGSCQIGSTGKIFWQYINSKSHALTQISLQLIYHYINKSNPRGINYFTNFFINRWCGESLLVNKKVILVVELDDNQ